MTKKLPFKRGSLLFHSSHGPCRITDIVKQNTTGKDQYFYSLESKQMQFRRVKFLVDAEQVRASGFHPAISSEEALKILTYLKTNDPKDRKLGLKQSQVVLGLIQENAPWSFARVVLIFSRETNGKGAKGKREMLARAVKGLALELSYALDIPEHEGYIRMKKSLQQAKVNPWVIQNAESMMLNLV